METDLDMYIKKEEDLLIENNDDDSLDINFDVEIKVENNWDLAHVRECFDDKTALEFDEPTVGYDTLVQPRKQECGLCNQFFYNSYSLLQHNLVHLKLETNQIQTYECKDCSAHFANKTDLTKHIQKHAPKTAISKSHRECGTCHKIYTYKHWHAHIAEVHGIDVYKCEHCKAKFKCLRYLKKHMKKHTAQYDRHTADSRNESGKLKETQNIQVFTCILCHGIYRSKDCLNQHIRNCHSKGTFDCDECRSSFKSEPYLRTHKKRVHYNDGKTYLCVCGKSYRSPRYLRVHVKNSSTSKKAGVIHKEVK